MVRTLTSCPMPLTAAPGETISTAQQFYKWVRMPVLMTTFLTIFD